MEKLKEYFSTKRHGFYLVLSTIVLAIVTIIIFFVGVGEGYLSWVSFGCLLALVLGDLILLALKKDNFVPALNTICSGLAIAFFINACYSYVATVMTGIDIESFSMPWILTTVFSVLLFVISIITVFAPLGNNTNTSNEAEKEII